MHPMHTPTILNVMAITFIAITFRIVGVCIGCIHAQDDIQGGKRYKEFLHVYSLSYKNMGK